MDEGTRCANHEAAAESAERFGPAFDRAFTGMLPRLRRAALALTGDPAAAEDVVHDAYLRIARRPERFLRHPRPYAYAVTAMANLVRDRWRRERRRGRSFDAARDEGLCAGPADGGLGELQAHWEVVRLLRCLTVKQARVVLLVDLAGYGVDEAAELLGVHRSTLHVTRRRALRRLRAVVERERPELRRERPEPRRGRPEAGRARPPAADLRPPAQRGDPAARCAPPDAPD